MKAVVSPKELAQAIGVSESSLKRWADEGRINVARTAGGHRRIPIAEAIRFIRGTQALLVHPEILGLSEVAGVQTDRSATETETDRLYAYLSNGQAREARDMIMSLYLRGESVAAICDGPIRGAMARIGELWQHDDAGVFLEHRATDICVQAVQQLRTSLDVPHEAPVALGGAPSGDAYILPSLAAATALSAEGFQTINLGPETPLSTLITAAKDRAARLVWLSISVVPQMPDWSKRVSAFAAELDSIGARLAIGGQGHDALRLATAGNVLVGRSMVELVAFAKGLLAGDHAVTPKHSAASNGHT